MEVSGQLHFPPALPTVQTDQNNNIHAFYQKLVLQNQLLLYVIVLDIILSQLC
jgi:hypothetical protein